MFNTQVPGTNLTAGDTATIKTAQGDSIPVGENNSKLTRKVHNPVESNSNLEESKTVSEGRRAGTGVDETASSEQVPRRRSHLSKSLKRGEIFSKG